MNVVKNLHWQIWPASSGKSTKPRRAKTFSKNLQSVIEADGDLHSIGELHDRMKEMAGSEDVYHRKYFKGKFQEGYGSSLFLQSWKAG